MHVNTPKSRLPRNVIIVACVALFSGLGQDMITPVLPGFLALLGFSRAGIGLIDGLLQGATSLFRFVSGILSDHVGKLPIISAGWLVLAFVEFGFSRQVSLTASLLLFAGYGLFFALTEGSARAFIADAVPAHSRGTAYAIFHTLIGLAVIAGGFGLGHIWDVQSPQLAFSISASGSFVGFVILALTAYHLTQAKRSM